MNTGYVKAQDKQGQSATRISGVQESKKNASQIIDLNSAQLFDQEKWHEIANDSKEVKQLKSFQDIANKGAESDKMTYLQTVINGSLNDQSQFLSNQSTNASLKHDAENTRSTSAAILNNNNTTSVIQGKWQLPSGEVKGGPDSDISADALWIELTASFIEIKEYSDALAALGISIEDLKLVVYESYIKEEVSNVLLIKGQVLNELIKRMPNTGVAEDEMGEFGHEDEPGAPEEEVISTEFLDIPYWKATYPKWLQDLFVSFGIFDRYGKDVAIATYQKWLQKGVMTRSQIAGLAEEISKQRGATQLARGAGPSGPKSYPSSTLGPFVGVEYTRDGDGYFDFGVPTARTTWKNPYKNGEVDMQKGYTKPGWGVLKDNKTVVKLNTATRSQHFSIANRITGTPGSGSPDNYTWHHLKAKYKMILVDRQVHRKHGHNGGIHLWK